MDFPRATTPPEPTRERLLRQSSRSPHQLPPTQYPEHSGFGYDGHLGWPHPQVPSFNFSSSPGFDKPTPVNDQAQYGEYQQEPFLQRTVGDDEIEFRESSTPKRTSIPRKPVAAYKIVEDAQPPSSISEATIKSTETRALKPLWRVWAPELASMLLSFLLFGVIIVVLDRFDQQNMPDWPLGGTLNTFLALFATLAKAAFIFPISVAISQTQWVWFNKETPRALYDFHVIDQASRGVWGSLVLLWRFRFRHFVAIGALLIAISTLTTPVMQLAINYPSKAIAVEGEANTQAIRHLGAPRDWLYMTARKAVFTSTFLDFTSFNKTLPYSAVDSGGVSCSSGNCTFDHYESLGVCLKFANISSHLTVEKVDDPMTVYDSLMHNPFNGSQTWTASLPGGYNISHQSNLTVFTDMLNRNHTFGFQNDPIQRTRIASFYIIYTEALNNNLNRSTWGDSVPYETIVANMRDMRHHAMEAFYYFCPQRVETKVQIGLETTETTDSLAPLDDENDNQPFLDIQCERLLGEQSFLCGYREGRGNETLTMHSRNENLATNKSLGSTDDEDFTAGYRAMEDMAGGLRIQMAGFVTVIPKPNGVLQMLARGSPFLPALHNFVVWNPKDPFNTERQRDRLTNMYTNVATSLSASMRFTESERLTRGVVEIGGQVWKEVTYVRITWGWITLLAVELTAAALFLALTIFTHSRSRVSDSEDSFLYVKGSSLAPLVALSEDCQAVAGGRLRPGEELEDIAKNLKVRIDKGQFVPVKELDGRGS